MRPLPNDKTHGVIHTVSVKRRHIDRIDQDLNLPNDAKQKLRVGD
jgi:hypothetical protein